MESPFYRENLESVLAFTGGAHVLNISQVGQYTGLGDPRTIRRHFPYFMNNIISAETLTKCLSGTPPKGLRKKVALQ